MTLAHLSPDQSQCSICRALVKSDSTFCGRCGARMEETPAQELRSVNYLLAELARWKSQGMIEGAQADALRRAYEQRRDELLTQIANNGHAAKTSTSAQAETKASAQTDIPAQPGATTQANSLASEQTPDQSTQQGAPPHLKTSFPTRSLFPSATRPRATRQLNMARVRQQPKPPRALIETLFDPHTLRLLLYTGAAMLVVGVVIWLRDALYLKLQEPLVQAMLLALGTVAVTAGGWYAVLRTRLRLTGRALTLMGALLVPINFWFLVRSGLISNNGRAWIVCALCALLYAHTALLVREKLYVYLACAASVATVWAIIFRVEREAYGLYAISLMACALIFLHVSRLFPRATNASDVVAENSLRETETDESETVNDREREWRPARFDYQRHFDYELWGRPLVRAALVGATLCAFWYMPLRLWSSPSFHDGIFRLRASVYDSSIAMLLFAAWAYALWFAVRFIYTTRRAALYMLSALALFWTEFLALDGLRASGTTHLLTLAATAFGVAVAARFTQDDALAKAIQRASAFVSLLLAPASFSVLLDAAPQFTFRQSAAFAFLAASFAALAAPRFCAPKSQRALGFASAVFASIAFVIALASASLESATLIAAACSLWPFALYACAQIALRVKRETHLASPFIRTADAEILLLLVWASVVALILNQTSGSSSGAFAFNLRPAMFCALSSVVLYSALRAWRDNSRACAGIGTVAALVLVAAVVDALETFGLWPRSWPISAVVVCASFLLYKASDYFLQTQRESNFIGARSPLDTTIRFVMDCAVILCALLWFTTTLFSMNQTGADATSFGAACVLLLALAYWSERAAIKRLAWPVRLAAAHAGAFFFALLLALRVNTRWFAAVFALVLFPIFFALGGASFKRGAEWLAKPLSFAAALTAALVFLAAILQAMPHLAPGNPLLLASCVTLGALALASFAASLFSENLLRVRYFRAGLYTGLVAFALACLRVGYDPATDTEIYTSPIAVALLVIAFLSARREWDEYARDTSQLLWAGSLLLCAPLLIHALQFRLLRDEPAFLRDLGALCAALALIMSGVMGRLRAPVLVGATTLIIELMALALTSVAWTQVPLKIYLMTVGALFLIVWGIVEYRREQLLLLRQRFNERRDHAREQFGQWR